MADEAGATPPDPAVGAANRSGFVLQLGLETEVRRTMSAHGYGVVAREVPWRGSEGEEGFVDLVLENGWVRLVVECKRVRDASWVFLVPEAGGDESRLRAGARWAWVQNTPLRGGLDDIHLRGPLTPEALDYLLPPNRP